VFEDGERFGGKPDYKTAALCKQVRRSVAMTLAGECGDEVLQSLIVDDVLPAPNAGRLLVRVILRSGDPTLTTIAVMERLAKVQGLLRGRIGEVIVRKRTPELSFEVMVLHPRAAGEGPGREGGAA